MNFDIIGYIILILGWLPLIWSTLRLNGIFVAPLFTTMIFSIFLINIVGSIVVFSPSLNIYGAKSIYSEPFLYIHLIQLLLCYLAAPIFLKSNFYIGGASPISFKPNFFIKSDEEFASIGKALFFSLIFIFLVIFVFGNITNNAPLINLSDVGVYSVLMGTRTEFFETGFSFIWIYRIAIYLLPQFVCVLLLLNYLSKRNAQSLFAFTIAFLFSVFLSLLFLHKYPLFLLIFSLLVTYIFYNKNYNLKIILVALSILLLVVIGTYLLFFLSTFESEGLEYARLFSLQILNRMFGAYPISTAEAILLVNNNGFWMGEAQSLVFNSSNPQDARILSEVLHYKIFGLPGNAPASAIGSAYVDFGYIGVFFTQFCLFFVIFIIEKLLAIIKESNFRIALTVVFMTKIMFISMTSFADVFTSPTELAAFFGLFLLYNISTIRFKTSRLKSASFS